MPSNRGRAGGSPSASSWRGILMSPGGARRRPSARFALNLARRRRILLHHRNASRRRPQVNRTRLGVSSHRNEVKMNGKDFWTGDSFVTFKAWPENESSEFRELPFSRHARPCATAVRFTSRHAQLYATAVRFKFGGQGAWH